MTIPAKTLPLLAAALLAALSTAGCATRDARRVAGDDVLDARLEAASGRFAGVLATAGPGEAPRFAVRAADADGDPLRRAYPLASVTKVFTSAAVLELVEQSRLALDAPVSAYWPHIADRPAAAVTIRQLLAHTSGVPSVMQSGQGLDATLDPASWPAPSTLDAQLAPVLPLPLRFAPGTRYAYSNSGYLMLAKVIEQVTGQPYDRAIANLVLAPLDLADQACFCADLPAVDDVAPREWDGDGTRAATLVHPTRAAAAGGLRMTPAALAAWLQAVADGRLLEPATLAEAWAPGHPTRRPGEHMGLGWLVREQDGRRIVLHDGTLPGAVATVAIDPASRRVALGLVTPTLPLDAVSRSEDYVRERVVALARGERSVDAPRAGDDAADDLAGDYALADGRTLALRREGARWSAELRGGGSPLELRQAIRLDTPFAQQALLAARALATQGQAGLLPHLAPALRAQLPAGTLDGMWSQWTDRHGAFEDVHVYGANPAGTAARLRFAFERGAVDLGFNYGADGIAGLQLLGGSRPGLPSRVAALPVADGALWIDGYRHDADALLLLPRRVDGRVAAIDVGPAPDGALPRVRQP